MAGEARSASLGRAAVPCSWRQPFHFAEWSVLPLTDALGKLSLLLMLLKMRSCKAVSWHLPSSCMVTRMVLNPYTSYEEMVPICRMVLEKDPKVVCHRDGFKLAPLDA